VEVTVQLALVCAGVIAVVVGVWMIFMPAGLIAGGLGVIGVGLLWAYEEAAARETSRRSHRP
jgi:hypothetical protein